MGFTRAKDHNAQIQASLEDAVKKKQQEALALLDDLDLDAMIQEERRISKLQRQRKIEKAKAEIWAIAEEYGIGVRFDTWAPDAQGEDEE